jgi:hypothetical protein
MSTFPSQMNVIEVDGGTLYFGKGVVNGGEILVRSGRFVTVTPSWGLLGRMMMKGTGLKGEADFELLLAVAKFRELAVSQNLAPANFRSCDAFAEFLEGFTRINPGPTRTFPNGRPRLIGKLFATEKQVKAQAWRILRAEWVAAIGSLDTKRLEKIAACLRIAEDFEGRRWLKYPLLSKPTKHVFEAIVALARGLNGVPTKAEVRKLGASTMNSDLPASTLSKALKELGFDWLPRAKTW